MWQGDAEHTELLAVAGQLRYGLFDLKNRLVFGDVQHVYHEDAASRCRSLSLLLDCALDSAKKDRYGAAFSTLRTSLEHVYIDRLALQGEDRARDESVSRGAGFIRSPMRVVVERRLGFTISYLPTTRHLSGLHPLNSTSMTACQSCKRENRRLSATNSCMSNT